MKEYTNTYSGAKTQNELQLWDVDLYDGDTVVKSITGLPREDDANAIITTWVVQEAGNAMDRTEETDPVDWDDPLFERDFIKS